MGFSYLFLVLTHAPPELSGFFGKFSESPFRIKALLYGALFLRKSVHTKLDGQTHKNGEIGTDLKNEDIGILSLLGSLGATSLFLPRFSLRLLIARVTSGSACANHASISVLYCTLFSW